MAYVDFISVIHKRTTRDYLQRVNDPEFPKHKAAEMAKPFGYHYWDGDRRTGYGGFKYDGRWRKVADEMVKHYGIKPGDRILDIGVGKGFLLHDLTEAVPGVKVVGLDISNYALKAAMPQLRGKTVQGTAWSLPFPDKCFDLVISINTHHVLQAHQLDAGLREMERVGKKNKYLCVESWRNESEKANLLYWQLTCEAFETPAGWDWWLKQTGYTGDHSFIYFE